MTSKKPQEHEPEEIPVVIQIFRRVIDQLNDPACKERVRAHYQNGLRDPTWLDMSDMGHWIRNP